MLPRGPVPPKGTHAIVEMALNPQSSSDTDCESIVVGAPRVDSKDDVEHKPRRNSRVAGRDAGERATVGKQLELEAENAIKYRTCSWQKVLLF